MPHSFLPRTRQQALTLWTFVGAVLALALALIGVGYIISPGNSKSTNLHVIEALVPGGMRTHGFILLMLAFGMTYAVLTKFDGRSKWVLRVTAGYSFLFAISMFGSWAVTGAVVWAGPIMWTALGGLAEGMVLLPPDSLTTREEARHAPRHPLPAGGRH